MKNPITDEYNVGSLKDLLLPHYKTIILSADEMIEGISWGKKIWALNKADGRIDERSSEDAEIAWVHSEMAVSKWAGIPYGDPNGKWTRVPDCEFLDVKYTSEIEHGLAIRENQPNNRVVISVSGIAPTMILRGWELSQHIRKWGYDIALKNREKGKPVPSMFDKEGKLIYPWQQLKPMYLLNRNRADYQICFACPGTGIMENNLPCQDCILGKMLTTSPEALQQLLRVIK